MNIKRWIAGGAAICLLMGISGCRRGGDQPKDPGSEPYEESSLAEEPTEPADETTEIGSLTTTAETTEATTTVTTTVITAATTTKATPKTKVPATTVKKNTTVKTTAKKPTTTTKAPTTTKQLTTKKPTKKPTTSWTINLKEYGTPDIEVTYDTARAAQILEWMNRDRKKYDIGELKMDNGNMMTAAQIRVKESTITFHKGDNPHTRPNGASYKTIVDQCRVLAGLSFPEETKIYFGENLAYGDETLENVYKAWQASPDHWANILKPTFNYVSIAVIKYGDYWYYCQLFRT